MGSIIYNNMTININNIHTTTYSHITGVNNLPVGIYLPVGGYTYWV